MRQNKFVLSCPWCELVIGMLIRLSRAVAVILIGVYTFSLIELEGISSNFVDKFITIKTHTFSYTFHPYYALHSV